MTFKATGYAQACNVIAEKIAKREHWEWAQKNPEKWDKS